MIGIDELEPQPFGGHPLRIEAQRPERTEWQRRNEAQPMVVREAERFTREAVIPWSDPRSDPLADLRAWASRMRGPDGPIDGDWIEEAWRG